MLAKYYPREEIANDLAALAVTNEFEFLFLLGRSFVSFLFHLFVRCLTGFLMARSDLSNFSFLHMLELKNRKEI